MHLWQLSFIKKKKKKQYRQVTLTKKLNKIRIGQENCNRCFSGFNIFNQIFTEEWKFCFRQTLAYNLSSAMLIYIYIYIYIYILQVSFTSKLCFKSLMSTPGLTGMIPGRAKGLVCRLPVFSSSLMLHCPGETIC